MTINAQPDDRKVAWILVAVIVSEGVWVLWSLVADPVRFVAVLGFAPSGSGSISGWILGAGVAALYVWSAAKIPAVRDNLLRPTFLKALAILAAAMTRPGSMSAVMTKCATTHAARPRFEITYTTPNAKPRTVVEIAAFSAVARLKRIRPQIE